MLRFTKMQGIGNDYLYINCFDQYVPNPGALAKQMCREHYGVGADGIVLIEPGETSPFAMRIFNRDGSEAEMCGNACRCIGKYVYERGLTQETEFNLDTKSGIRSIGLEVENGKVLSVRVDMGTPELTPEKIPVNLTGNMVLKQRIQVMGQLWFMTCVNMGNPHCVMFVRDPEVLDLETIGPVFEHHELFPNRTNVEFVRVIDRGTLQMRVWERGSGETLACGTGACASLVAAVLCGNADRNAEVRLAGGNLRVTWSGEDNHVYQQGPAEFVFDGEWNG